MSASATLIRPHADLFPDDEAAVAELIASRRAPLRIVGNETRKSMLRPVEADATLSTRALTGITLYEPKELIISARAGTPVADIERALAERGQYMIAEPPAFAFHETNAAPTIGGLVAANLSGPRRVAWGATRDHVMGVRAVNGRGEALRYGGRVLKNVTGLDICKLLTGSHGTLAVLTEVTLKVLPAAGSDRRHRDRRPRCHRRRGCHVRRPRIALWRLRRRLPASVAAAARVPALASLGASATAHPHRGFFEASVAYRIDRLLGDTRRLDRQARRRQRREPLSPQSATCARSPMPKRCGASPSAPLAAPRDREAPLEAARCRDVARLGGRPRSGQRLPSPTRCMRRSCAAALASGGTYTVMRSPEAFARAVDVVAAGTGRASERSRAR